MHESKLRKKPWHKKKKIHEPNENNQKKKDHHELGRMIKKSKWANQEGT